MGGTRRVHVRARAGAASAPFTLVPSYPDLPMGKVYTATRQTDTPMVFARRIGRGRVIYFPLLFDAYHLQISEVDVTRSIERLLPRIGRIQIAGNPGRHEPGTGETDYAGLLPPIGSLGYARWIGCEYVPAAGTLAGLGWAQPYLDSAAAQGE